MLELLYATGLRVTELVSLDINDIALESDPVTVRCMGKGDRERVLPLHQRPTDELRQYIFHVRPRLVRNRREPALFVNRRGERLTRQGFWLILKNYARDANLEAGDHPAHAAPHLRDAHALGRDAAPQRAGCARPRQHLHDADLHAPDRPAEAHRVRQGPPAGVNAAPGPGLPQDLLDALSGRDAAPALRDLDSSGRLTKILPELERGRGFTQPELHYYDVLDHCMATVSALDAVLGDGEDAREFRESAGWIDIDASLDREIDGLPLLSLLRLSCLLHDVAKPDTAIFLEDRLRFPRHGPRGAEIMARTAAHARLRRPASVQFVTSMIRYHLRPGELDQGLAADRPRRAPLRHRARRSRPASHAREPLRWHGDARTALHARKFSPPPATS